MTFREIMDLRKIDPAKAYENALINHQENPNEWTLRALSWCIYDGLKESAKYSTKDAFISKLKEMKSLELPSEETMLWNNLIWPIGAFIRDCASLPNISEGIFSEILELIKDFHFIKPSKEFSVLLNSFLKAKNWRNLADFCEWWNFDNLRPEDFQCDEINGRKLPTSLAENAHLAYARALLAKKDAGGIRKFIPKLQSLVESHPDMVYSNYYLGKLLIASGEHGENTINAVLPFVKKKKNEFWAWQLLAEVFEDDEEKYLACLLRAVNCRTKDEFLQKIYLRLATVFLEKRYCSDAAFYLNKHIEAKKKSQSTPSYEVTNLLKQNWYKDIADPKPNYNMDYMAITNGLILSDVSEIPAVITFVNIEKMIANVVYGKNKTGFLKYGKSLGRISHGDVLALKIENISPEGRINIFSAKKVTSLHDNEFYKTVTGQISTNPQRTVFFLKDGNNSYYIPQEIVGGVKLELGDKATFNVLYSFNKKKNIWQWKCIRFLGMCCDKK